MYRFLRSIMFLLPAEAAHYFAMNGLKALCSLTILRKWITSANKLSGKHLSRHVFGLHFKNPVGLGAGFDKNARYLRELKALGFGFVEIGTVTPEAQAGNEKPRLFRLPQDKALINRMGFNNEGVEAITQRLKEWKKEESVDRAKGDTLLIGGNIG